MVSSPTRWSNTVPGRQAAKASPKTVDTCAPPSPNVSQLKAENLKLLSNLPAGWLTVVAFLLWVCDLLPPPLQSRMAASTRMLWASLPLKAVKSIW